MKEMEYLHEIIKELNYKPSVKDCLECFCTGFVGRYNYDYNGKSYCLSEYECPLQIKDTVIRGIKECQGREFYKYIVGRK